MSDRRLRPATVAAHAGAGADPATGALSPPLHLSSTYRHGNRGGFEYTRDDHGHPTWALLERTLAALEEGEHAVAMSSGLAAIAACVETLPVGARVVAPVDAYSGTRQLLDTLHDQERVVRTYVDIADTDEVATACRSAALLILESLTNPLLRVPDITACAEAAHSQGATVVVDNTFATPICLRPLTLGADVSVHSLSKYAGGHSDAVLGAAVVRDGALAERLVTRRTLGGAIPGQMEAWLVLRGLRTLDVRVRRQMESAAVLAARLAEHPDVTRVHHPSLPSHPQHDRARAQMQGGLGAVVSIEVAGDADRAETVCEAVTVWEHATSLGGVESTLERRARYPYDAAVVSASLVRLSVGVEDVDDLYDDLDAALRGTRPAG